MIISNRSSCTPYITKDGSTIRELMHPDVHGNRSQSFAEAIVAPGKATAVHKHSASDEIYHITQGSGLMTIEGQQRAVAAGCTIAIPAGSYHSIENTADVDLVMMCVCHPPYSHTDTTLETNENP